MSVSEDMKKKALGAFITAHYTFSVLGIQWDNKESIHSAYFTYPEFYSDSCNDSELANTLGIVFDGKNPKTLSADLAKRYFCLGLIIKDIDSFDDECLAYALEDPLDILNVAPIKFFSKPRLGETWTLEMAEDAYKKTADEVGAYIKKVSGDRAAGDYFSEV